MTKHYTNQLYLDKKKYKKKLEGKIINASKRALSNNPGSEGEKRRKCAVSQNQPVSPKIVKACEELLVKVDNMSADFRDAMVSFTWVNWSVIQVY